MCATGPANCTAPGQTALLNRACTSQSSTLGKNNFTWHDLQLASALSGWNHDCVCGLGVCPPPAGDTMAVDLIAFTATPYAGGVRLEWQTGFEVGNLGFNLYREVAGERTPITLELIAGSALQEGPSTVPGAGTSYTWLDTGAPGEEGVKYWLEDVSIHGFSSWHGPIEVQPSPPGAP